MMTKPERERRRKAERRLMEKLGYSSPAYLAHKQAVKNRVARKEFKAYEGKLLRKAKKNGTR